MRQISQETKKTIATLLCYVASWGAFILGGMWVWLGLLSLRNGTVNNAIFNPILLLDGLIVIVAGYFILKKSKLAMICITGYALCMELFLQYYQLHNFGYVRFKPYFILEFIALVAGNIGVFWWAKL